MSGVTMRKQRYDWETIRAEYEAGSSMGKLSDKYGVDKAAISRRAKKEAWAQDVTGAVDRAVDAKVNGIVNTVVKMLYTKKEKNEIERVRKVFEKHIQQMTAYDLVWSDKVGYVWLAISIDPVYIDTGNWIESAAGLCYECLNDIALDVFGMTGNDHDFEDADPLELAEIKRRWKPYIGQLPEYAYLCDELLSRSK